MKKFTKTIIGSAACIALSGPAFAEQFIVSLSQPILETNAPVLETLKVSVVDEFEHEGDYIAILDAPNEAHLETLFNVIGPKAVSLKQLPVDWTDDAMAQIDVAARLKFGNELVCGFCS